MLTIKSFFLFLILNMNVFAIDKSVPGVFEKDVLSKMLKPKCEYLPGDETGVFSIKYTDGESTHVFLVMRGIDPETCKWHEREVKKIMKSSKIVTIKGLENNEYLVNGKKEYSWMWTLIKTQKKCHSYFINGCPKD